MDFEMVLKGTAQDQNRNGNNNNNHHDHDHDDHEGVAINASNHSSDNRLRPLSTNNPSSNSTVVQLTNIHKTYLLGIEGVPALRGVDLDIKQGEFVIIYGTSGGGKTSLLNLVGTIDAPTKGGLTLFNTRIDRKTNERALANIRMCRMGFVFQTFNLISSMTALENVELPMILMGKLNKAQRHHRAKQLLERVGVAARMNHLPAQLSGGEQQRVTIARALVNSPDLLLLDEPTGDLDTRNTDVVMNLLMELNAEGITMLMVTHDDSLKNCAHRVVHMMDGRVNRIVPVPPEDRRQQIQRLQHASRTLRTGISENTNSSNEDSFTEDLPTLPSTCTMTTLRKPAQYTMQPKAVPYSGIASPAHTEPSQNRDSMKLVEAFALSVSTDFGQIGTATATANGRTRSTDSFGLDTGAASSSRSTAKQNGVALSIS